MAYTIMKKSIFQHILGWLPAEEAHNLRLMSLRLVGKIPTGRWWLKMCHAPRKINLERNVFGMHFKNPIGIGAGIDPNAQCLNEFAAIGFGFMEIGTVTYRSQHGSPRPRLCRFKGRNSLINNSGYPSLGMEYVIERVRNRSKCSDMILGCCIGKLTTTHRAYAPKEYLRVFRNLYQYVDFFTVNISSNSSAKPYVPRAREEIQQLIEPLFEFRRGQQDYRPILLKISPDLTREELDTIIDILIETPLDGIEAVAGSQKLSPDGRGAVSGAMLTDRAIEMVRYIAKRTKGNYPIIGAGGMMTPEDIRRMIDAGASLVALNSGIRTNGIKLLKQASKALVAKDEITPATEAVSEQNNTTENSQS